MSAMSPVVREAVRLVRESLDFTLLDCLELLDRRRGGEKIAFATMRWCGQTLIGYGHCEVADADSQEVDCPECEGFGEVEAQGSTGRTRDVECPWCEGSGSVDADDVEEAAPTSVEKLKWRTLNGQPVAVSIEGSVRPKFYDYAKAAAYVREVEKAMTTKAEAA